MTEQHGLEMDLVEAVLERMGLDAVPATDPPGLAELYRAWCRSVPFDNTLKLISLHGDSDDEALPGMDAADFLRSWLRHGTGGTCFPSSNALHELASACGFDSRRVIASMRDMRVPSHGTTVVTLEGSEWLIDSSMLTDEPLELPTSGSTAIEHPVHAATAEVVDEGWLFSFSTLNAADPRIACRTISTAAVQRETMIEYFEASRVTSVFNNAPSVRRNDAAGILCYGGGKRFRRTADGIEETELGGEALWAGLVGEFGLSDEIVARLSEVLGSRPPQT